MKKYLFFIQLIIIFLSAGISDCMESSSEPEQKSIIGVHSLPIRMASPSTLPSWVHQEFPDYRATSVYTHQPKEVYVSKDGSIVAIRNTQRVSLFFLQTQLRGASLYWEYTNRQESTDYKPISFVALEDDGSIVIGTPESLSRVDNEHIYGSLHRYTEELAYRRYTTKNGIVKNMQEVGSRYTKQPSSVTQTVNCKGSLSISSNDEFIQFPRAYNIEALGASEELHTIAFSQDNESTVHILSKNSSVE